ncbi:MAG: 2-hydroxyhepta-2,4-diene-1,7-dioate isomerase, partial [Candidatus Competibacteraceae bacterium]|nr:2-hydroxyhepta-2,4-diene-1,7-dioate isomerase [Candidatus Competibacteraceae bacterium]
MKFVRFGDRNAEKPGLLDAAGNIRDLSGVVPDLSGAVLTDLQRLQSIDPESLPLVDGSPRLGACVAGTGKFICIGLNYSDHAEETGHAVPSEPVIFMKATSA